MGSRGAPPEQTYIASERSGWSSSLAVSSPVVTRWCHRHVGLGATPQAETLTAQDPASSMRCQTAGRVDGLVGCLNPCVSIRIVRCPMCHIGL